MKILKLIWNVLKHKHDNKMYLQGDETVFECKKCGRKLIIIG